MESTVRWTGDLRFEGTFSTGHTMVLDGPKDHGGTDEGARPVELLLMGLAGCTAMDVVAILQKKRQKVGLFQVHVSGERSEKHPRVYTKLHIVYEVAGEKIDQKAVEQAVALSEERYCSVSAMLRPAASITSEIRIEEGGS